MQAMRALRALEACDGVLGDADDGSDGWVVRMNVWQCMARIASHHWCHWVHSNRVSFLATDSLASLLIAFFIQLYNSLRINTREKISSDNAFDFWSQVMKTKYIWLWFGSPLVRSPLSATNTCIMSETDSNSHSHSVAMLTSFSLIKN